TVALTLDDGYGDNFLNLRAIAQATGVPLTLFVCPGKISQQAAFDHDLKWGLPDFRPLTWGEVQKLDRDGIQIASHTRSHFDCGSTQRERLCDEITGAKHDLEMQLGKDVTYFAFPWGKPENMSGPALGIARNYYTNVFSAFGGENHPDDSGQCWHFRRVLHPNDLWELELALQSILEFGTPCGSDHVERLSDC
ncbi:MAG TPA: polysaccharide deacetylase family protein, partial [Planctomycetaceae bacterium]